MNSLHAGSHEWPHLAATGGTMSNGFSISLIVAGACLVALPTPASAQCKAATQLSGRWTSNDGGTYWVHRVAGNVVWWVGLSGDDGKSWTNVFRGTLNGNAITGEWADVRGKAWGNGTLTLQLYRFDTMTKVGATGSGFGASRWGRGGCNDTGP